MRSVFVLINYKLPLNEDPIMEEPVLLFAPDILDTQLFSWEPKSPCRKAGLSYNAKSNQAFGVIVSYRHLAWTRTACRMSGLAFETLIDDSLSKITNVAQLKTLINKRVLSMVNDFEDKKWRNSRFQNYLWDNIAQTALSERERLALANQSHSTLVAAAKNLRLTDRDEVGQGSEIAEVFLYGIMKNHYGALPVVPKIFYKQNVQDNAKGADSVHIVVDNDTNDFTLWFGEAKFYNSIADARLDSVVNSVYTSLDTGKLKKENSIITNVSDLDHINIDISLRNKIKAALGSQLSIDYLKPRIHVPILIIHQCAETAKCTELSEEYRTAIAEHHKERADAYFSRQLSRSERINKYDEIKFHLILFPVPNKKEIVETFLGAVSFYKGAA